MQSGWRLTGNYWVLVGDESTGQSVGLGVVRMQIASQNPSGSEPLLEAYNGKALIGILMLPTLSGGMQDEDGELS